MYSSRPALTYGFHGCDKSLLDDIILGKTTLKPSKNPYDWLGNGMYFWDNNPSRAFDYANTLKAHPKRAKRPITEPLPQNTSGGSKEDLLHRELDCFVIQSLHQYRLKRGLRPYDSVRGVFWEGKLLYPDAGFREKNHIQICICNPNCIKAYFRPRMEKTAYPQV